MKKNKEGEKKLPGEGGGKVRKARRPGRRGLTLWACFFFLVTLVLETLFISFSSSPCCLIELPICFFLAQ